MKIHRLFMESSPGEPCRSFIKEKGPVIRNSRLNPKIVLFYIDSGGGHRAAASALCEVVRRQQRPWDLNMVSLQDVLDPIDFVRKLTGVPFQDIYNIMLRRGWTLGTRQLIPLMHLVIRCCHRAQVRVLKQYWEQCWPDLVVSVVPHYNRALKEALDLVAPGTPYVTVLTDIADYPPHFWIEKMDQHVVCGSARAVAQARNLGIPGHRIHQTSGMILHPDFYEAAETDRAEERIRLGLRPDLPTGLVLFGGEGSIDLVKVARALNRKDLGLQLILICGRHRAAERELRALTPHIPMWIEGFTREVPRYMQLADFLIGKPGPGSISEALAKRLPVIVKRDAWTLAHERYNTRWIEEQGIGLVVKNFSEIASAVETLLAPANWTRFQQRVSFIQNTAVYEIPEILADILNGAHHDARIRGSNVISGQDLFAIFEHGT